MEPGSKTFFLAVRKNLEQSLERRKHVCPICQKSFKLKTHIKNHMAIHSDDKPFQCLMCPKQFKVKGYLTDHMKRHSEEKQYECSLCPKKFSQRCGLSVHSKVHYNEQHICQTCSKTFIRKSDLDRHIKRMHLNAKPFNCDVCLKGYIIKCDLIIHMRVHSGLKPYKCDMCGKKFPRKDILIDHLRVHSSVKSFKCTICDKAFIRRSTLYRHLKTHANEQLRLLSSQGLKEHIEASKERSLKGYLGAIVKKDIGGDLEPNRSDFCFEVPIIKQEIKTEDFPEDQTPSCSYPSMQDATCINLFDSSLIKDEPEISRQ